MWKEAKGYEGRYEVSREGNIRSVDRLVEVENRGTKYLRIFKGIDIKPQFNNKGYYRVRIDGKNVFLHRLIATTFIPNLENYEIVNHKDGDPSNNSVDNLEWCTRSYNAKYAYDNGHAISVKGESKLNSKLTEEEVIWILKNYVKGSSELGRKPLARKFNVSHQCIKNIIDRKKWKHIQL